MLRSTSTFTALVLALATTSSVLARPDYIARVPNGANVPGVPALGHVDTAGGGPRNQFGLDFNAAGRTWTAELCAKDSDGDGQTNGQELGDPCCAFVAGPGAKVQWTTGVSHPGDATKMSSPSLWASVSCSGSSNATTSAPSPTAASGSNTTTAGTSAPAAAAGSSSPASAPSPSPTSGAATTAGAATFVVGGAIIALVLA